jgi:hypothetical protein
MGGRVPGGFPNKRPFSTVFFVNQSLMCEPLTFTISNFHLPYTLNLVGGSFRSAGGVGVCDDCEQRRDRPISVPGWSVAMHLLWGKKKKEEERSSPPCPCQLSKLVISPKLTTHSSLVLSPHSHTHHPSPTHTLSTSSSRPPHLVVVVVCHWHLLLL